MTRRRMISITAGFAGLNGVAAPGAGAVIGASTRTSTGASIVHEWRGIALGAMTSIKLAHENRDEAVRILAKCRSEVDRLENIFSLYRPESEISRLNQDGVLLRPSNDMGQCLAEATRIGDITGGAFDISVAPLWDHYARAGQTLEDQQSALETALAKVDYRAVQQESGRIVFGQEGMAITLNGIAQGYITDRVARLLGEYGYSKALVSLGEMQALEAPDDGRPWAVGVAGLPGANTEISLENSALATSSANGLVFPPSERNAVSRVSHLINPHTGLASPLWEQVSVIAPNATCADALSTGLSFMERSAWPNILTRAGANKAIGLGADNQSFEVERPATSPT